MRRRHRPRHSNHFQRVHRHTTRGAQRQDPDECGCGGGGWILSDCDVWARCAVHYDGQPHPEDRREPLDDYSEVAAGDDADEGSGDGDNSASPRSEDQDLPFTSDDEDGSDPIPDDPPEGDRLPF